MSDAASMQLATPGEGRSMPTADKSIGRIVSVTGSKAIVLLDSQPGGVVNFRDRPDMGTLLAIDTPNTVVLAIVSALSVPVPATREDEAEIWIAELGLVGELWRDQEGNATIFARGVTAYPSLGNRVRVASKAELSAAFCGDPDRSVRIGCIRQDSTIPAMIRVDDLLGKHFAILGTTGTGKSCTTALILRSILERNPAAHIVLLDPHNEYATAFAEWAEVISPRNMQLPFWLLNFEEVVEVLIADQSRKAEIEILQELIPIAKARYSAGRSREALRRAGVPEQVRFTVDTPVPYRISDLTGLIDERMGKLENKKDLSPYRQLKLRIDSISQDARYAFMFGSLTVYDGMTQVLSRIFRVPVNNKPITIVELTGLPTEIINVVVSVLARMTFDFAHWSEGKVPLNIVCEEAHRYVPAADHMGFEPCKRAIAKIAKEGRKYGVSLCIVSQRPAEVDPTILSQCNTVFALRMSNDRDQEIVTSAISDTGSGLLEFLPSLGQREALAFGDGVALPVRIKFDELPVGCLPRSTTARFTEHWQRSVGDDGFLENVVERWRSSDISAGGDITGSASFSAEEYTPDDDEAEENAGSFSSAASAPAPSPAAAAPRVSDPYRQPRAAVPPAEATMPSADATAQIQSPAAPEPSLRRPPSSDAPPTRTAPAEAARASGGDTPLAGQPAYAPSRLSTLAQQANAAPRSGFAQRKENTPPAGAQENAPPADEQREQPSTLKSLRERLIQRQQR
ncbi:Bipolar DNA helicase [Hyphomicrobium sulfonivorans]|uniref:Bipolar DNA helicase n=2 Tax=Hyphomicrobium sulfonivorans TaxID=121290 RepID=A0A120CWV9_HYPSL|nr:Bipolar DNA helicase [Hyphomicrobium sulfonivorans]